MQPVGLDDCIAIRRQEGLLLRQIPPDLAERGRDSLGGGEVQSRVGAGRRRINHPKLAEEFGHPLLILEILIEVPFPSPPPSAMRGRGFPSLAGGPLGGRVVSHGGYGHGGSSRSSTRCRVAARTGDEDDIRSVRGVNWLQCTACISQQTNLSIVGKQIGLAVRAVRILVGLLESLIDLCYNTPISPPVL